MYEYFLHPPQILQPGKRPPRRVHVQNFEGSLPDGLPVRFRDAQAGRLVGQAQIFFVQILVHGRAQRHLDRGHAVDVKAEDFGSGEPDDKAHHLLLVGGELGSLDA